MPEPSYTSNVTPPPTPMNNVSSHIGKVTGDSWPIYFPIVETERIEYLLGEGPKDGPLEKGCETNCGNCGLSHPGDEIYKPVFCGGDAGLDLSFPVMNIGKDVGFKTYVASLSVVDFNIFRLQMIKALDELDQKMRDILSVTPPKCD